MHREIHIASLLLHIKSAEVVSLVERLSSLPRAEHHLHDDGHKMIVVFEANSESMLSSVINDIGSYPGVLSAQLCYHHCEPVESLEEEMENAIYTT